MRKALVSNAVWAIAADAMVWPMDSLDHVSSVVNAAGEMVHIFVCHNGACTVTERTDGTMEVRQL